MNDTYNLLDIGSDDGVGAGVGVDVGVGVGVGVGGIKDVVWKMW